MIGGDLSRPEVAETAEASQASEDQPGAIPVQATPLRAQMPCSGECQQALPSASKQTRFWNWSTLNYVGWYSENR